MQAAPITSSFSVEHPSRSLPTLKYPYRPTVGFILMHTFYYRPTRLVNYIRPNKFYIFDIIYQVLNIFSFQVDINFNT